MAKRNLQLGTINISAPKNDTVTIDIDGIIGIPEWWQFDSDDERVATYDKFQKIVKDIKNTKAKKVDVNIRSLGGCVGDALLIHAAICTLDAEITTVCYGYVASAATLIAQAGKTRKVCSNSLYLIHRCSNVIPGNAITMQQAADSLNKTDTVIAQLYAQRSGQTLEFYQEVINRNNGEGEWLTPQEVIDLKLADEILTLTSSMNIDPDILAEFNYPLIPSNLLSTPFDANDEKFFQRFTNWFKTNLFNQNTNNQNNQSNMKIDWKTVNQILNVEGFDVKDGKLSFTENQVQTIEDKFTDLNKSVSDEKTRADTAENSLKTANDTISAHEQTIAELNEQIKNLKANPGAESNEVPLNIDGNVVDDSDLTSISNSKKLFEALSGK